MEKNYPTNVEQHLERISGEVKEYQQQKGIEQADRNAVKEVLRPYVERAPAQSSAPSSGISPVLPNYLQNDAPEVKAKVTELVNGAFQHGIEKSIAEAARYGPYILDAFHDALTSKVYDELKLRRLI